MVIVATTAKGIRSIRHGRVYVPGLVLHLLYSRPTLQHYNPSSKLFKPQDSE